MTQINVLVLTDKESDLLAELAAIQQQKRRRGERNARSQIAYTVTPYGHIPTSTWDAYLSATAD